MNSVNIENNTSSSDFDIISEELQNDLLIRKPEENIIQPSSNIKPEPISNELLLDNVITSPLNQPTVNNIKPNTNHNLFNNTNENIKKTKPIINVEPEKKISNVISEPISSVSSDTVLSNNDIKSFDKLKKDLVKKPNNTIKKIQKTNNIKVLDTSHLLTLYGYSIPYETIYFILVLLVVAFLIYYMTSSKSKEKEEDEEENKV